jgi:hypothetical protein
MNATGRNQIEYVFEVYHCQHYQSYNNDFCDLCHLSCQFHPHCQIIHVFNSTNVITSIWWSLTIYGPIPSMWSIWFVLSSSSKSFHQCNSFHLNREFHFCHFIFIHINFIIFMHNAIMLSKWCVQFNSLI